MNFEEIEKQDHDYLMQTYGRFPAALVSGKGAVATDAEGIRYLDFTAGIGVNSLGYCDEIWVEAVSQQVGRLQHTSNLYYNPVQTRLAQTLCRASGMSKVFLCNSGAEANECAIKLARKYGTHDQKKPRDGIITLTNSFHGRTVTTLSATGQDEFHQYFTPFTAGFFYASPDLDTVKLIAEENEICAVLIELIQGEGGVVPMDMTFIKGLSEFCRRNGILLMIDEVQTGIGRTGSLFCYEQYGIQPDVVTAAKGLGGGLPIGACLCAPHLADVMGSGSHGSTFGGNPVACAGALAVLERLSEPDFYEEVKRKGDYLAQKLAGIEGIEEVRGMGLMRGAVLADKTPGASKKIASACVENGLLVLTAKELLRFLPPLTITDAELDEGLEILQDVLENNQ